MLGQTLGMAQQSAFEQSFVLRSDRARQEGAEARLRGSIDAFMPSVALLGSKPLDSKIKYHPDIPTSTFGPDTTPRRDAPQYGIAVELPLFDGFQRWNGLLSARTLAEAGRALTLDARQQVLLDTAGAYLAVIRDRKILGHRERQLAGLRTIQASVQTQLSVNDATRTDAALAASRVADAQAGIALAAADLRASELEFLRLTGRPADRVSAPPLPPVPRDEAALVDLVRGNNPRLVASRLDAEAAGYLAEAAKGALMPQVALQFSHGRRLDITETLKSVHETVTRVQARIPLYEPGAFPKIAEASAFARQKWYDTEDAVRQTVTAARAAFARRAAIQSQVASLAARTAAMRSAVRGFEIERGAGFRTILDELNTRAELAQAEILLATGECERERLAFALAALTGRLTDPNRLAVAGPIVARTMPGEVLTTGSLKLPPHLKPPAPVAAAPRPPGPKPKPFRLRIGGGRDAAPAGG